MRLWRRRRGAGRERRSLGLGAAVTVLQRKDLEDSPLADLHAIASELGLEGYRALRKDDLIAAILQASGGDEAAAPKAEAEPEEVEPDEVEPDEVPSDEALEGPPGAPAEVFDEEEAEREVPAVEEEPEVVEDEVSEEEIVSGVLDIIANGSGFMRVDPSGQSRDDIYVSPAQIRRCELRAGDEVSGPVRPPRRNERHPSLIRVETVNGADAEPPEQRPWFGDLTAVFPSHRLPAPSSLESLPYGRGSRVAIAGAAGAGATTLLREIAAELGRLEDVAVQVVLAGVRPEEVTEWRQDGGGEIAGGSFERSPEAQAQAAELAVERAKRRVERGGHAAILIDSLAALPAGAQRRLFGAARATEEGGTLTVIATTRDGSEALRWATTRIVLESGGRPSGADSGTLRADRLS
jgi:transcription termination factor Rho